MNVPDQDMSSTSREASPSSAPASSGPPANKQVCPFRWPQSRQDSTQFIDPQCLLLNGSTFHPNYNMPPWLVSKGGESRHQAKSGSGRHDTLSSEHPPRAFTGSTTVTEDAVDATSANTELLQKGRTSASGTLDGDSQTCFTLRVGNRAGAKYPKYIFSVYDGSNTRLLKGDISGVPLLRQRWKEITGTPRPPMELVQALLSQKFPCGKFVWENSKWRAEGPTGNSWTDIVTSRKARKQKKAHIG